MEEERADELDLQTDVELEEAREVAEASRAAREEEELQRDAGGSWGGWGSGARASAGGRPGAGARAEGGRSGGRAGGRSRGEVGGREDREDESVWAAARQLNTVEEAKELCRELVEKQVARAREDGAPPNESIHGDAAVRAAMQLLLADAEQREVFLQMASDPRAWGRLRPIFGTPPYSFLRPGDAGAMRAAGFAIGRQNMTYDEARVANVNQFGPGHLVDEDARVYRVTPQGKQEQLPGSDYLRGASEVLLQVRLLKRSPEAKRALFRTNRKQLYFPRPGDRLALRESSQLMRVLGLTEPTSTNVVVKAVRPRAQGGYTAAIVVRAG